MHLDDFWAKDEWWNPDLILLMGSALRLFYANALYYMQQSRKIFNILCHDIKLHLNSWSNKLANFFFFLFFYFFIILLF